MILHPELIHAITAAAIVSTPEQTRRDLVAQQDLTRLLAEDSIVDRAMDALVACGTGSDELSESANPSHLTGTLARPRTDIRLTTWAGTEPPSHSNKSTDSCCQEPTSSSCLTGIEE